MNGINKSYENYILWQPAEKGVRIVRVYGKDPCLFLPEYIGDNPVTEIGPYCFSASLPRNTGQIFCSHPSSSKCRSVEAGERLSDSLESVEASHHSLCGNIIEAVRLPSTVTTLHNGAFYNCRSMKSLSVGPAIRGIGSDCFTNNRRFNRLKLRTEPTAAHGLKLLLERLAQDLTVSFEGEDPSSVCSLYFPEYYEWLDEISPAHLFSRTINGAGFRMRKCFQDSRLDFDKYDLCFESALREESAETICRICLCRLLTPLHLKELSRVSYEDALRDRLPAALSLSIEGRNASALSWILKTFMPDQKILGQARSLCLEKDWSEGAALLMEHSAAASSSMRFAFDFEFD